MNVNRTKTRKWVEAKVQSYDGDDWGDDGEDDDEPESPPAPLYSHRQPLGHRLPSQVQDEPPIREDPVPTSKQAHLENPEQTYQVPVPDPVQPFIQHEPLEPVVPVVSETLPSTYYSEKPKDLPSNTDKPGAADVVAAQHQIHPKKEENDHDDDDEDDDDDEPEKLGRVSTSPQLPDMVRMSTFGVDFLSSSDSTATKQPATVHEKSLTGASGQPVMSGSEPVVPGHKGPISDGNRTEPITENTDAHALDVPTIAEEEEEEEEEEDDDDEDENEDDKTDGSSHETSSAAKPPMLQSGADPKVLHQLKTTDSWETPIHHPLPESDITPTEPLQKLKPEDVADFEPPPVTREPTFGTESSSIHKESDALSQEIIRSLSPGGEHSTTRSFEEIKGDDPVKAVPIKSAPYPPPVSTISTNTQSNLNVAESPGRRRFSWEGPSENVTTQPATTQNQPPKPAPVQNLTKEVLTKDKAGSTASGESTGQSVADGFNMSHKASVSSAGQPSSNQSNFEQPSPINTTNKTAMNQFPPQFTTQDETSRPSLQIATTPPPPPSDTDVVTKVVTSSPVIQVPSHAQPQTQRPQIATFKEIMGSTNSVERIHKFEESRRALSSEDSGLENWLLAMKSQHQEHANATSSFSGDQAHVQLAGGPGGNAASGASTQQPYYQQYLNATSTSGHTPSTRSKLGGGSQGAGMGSFGSSGEKIGTKSKEFAKSAGKMGKGLFSKGKSKLRGTGDKVF